MFFFFFFFVICGDLHCSSLNQHLPSHQCSQFRKGWGSSEQTHPFFQNTSCLPSNIASVTALKNNEDSVVDSLKNADLECLSEDALEIGVIPQDVRDAVGSVDWDHVRR